jgi:hypothetical protein
MAAHKDYHFPAILEKSTIPFVQVLILLSEKGEHFHQGGGFVHDSFDNKIFLESASSLGSLVIFDGQITHGIDEIDLDEVLRWENLSGRLAILSNLYQTIA